MSELGANIDHLRATSVSMKTAGETLRSSSESLTDLLRRTTWQGQDSLAFNDLWLTKHKATLEQIASDLQSLATELAKQAQEQENTSNDSIQSGVVQTPSLGLMTSTEAQSTTAPKRLLSHVFGRLAQQTFSKQWALLSVAERETLIHEYDKMFAPVRAGSNSQSTEVSFGFINRDVTKADIEMAVNYGGDSTCTVAFASESKFDFKDIKTLIGIAGIGSAGAAEKAVGDFIDISGSVSTGSGRTYGWTGSDASHVQTTLLNEQNNFRNQFTGFDRDDLRGLRQKGAIREPDTVEVTSGIFESAGRECWLVRKSKRKFSGRS
jgi:uncharacterized protein YukE